MLSLVPAMNRTEFDQLRDLPGKTIPGDIRYLPRADASPALTFEGVPVENELDWPVLLNGRYVPATGHFTFNFVVKQVGPICRVCVNGPEHPGAGRTHKHHLRVDVDPRRNLPTAVARTDLATMTPSQVWADLCQAARIDHAGAFMDPITNPEPAP